MLAALGAERGSQAARLAALGGECQVLLDGERAAAAGQRILEDTGDEAGAGGGALAADIGLADHHLAFARQHIAGEHAEKCRFAGAIGADDGDEGALFDRQANAIQRLLLQRRTLAEDDLDVVDADHAAPPRRRRGRTRAKVTSAAVTKLRSEACSPSMSVDSAN
ncbi:hypothetical protein D9M70_534950 [compost metagenome]